MDYKNPTPVVVALIRVLQYSGTKLIAARRAIPPHSGQYAFPGGYVNEGESAEGAICREVYEETCIRTPQRSWRPITTRPTANNQLLIFMALDRIFPSSVMDDFVPNGEVDDLMLVDDGDNLCFPLHTCILRDKALWL